MAANTYVALETKTLGSAVSSVVFDVSTYTDYTDLQIVFSGGVSTASVNSFMRFNNDTASNYCAQMYEGRQGGTANTVKFASSTAIQLDYYGSPSTTKSMLTIDIFSFRKTGYYRPVLVQYGDTTNSTYSGVGFTDGLWFNTTNAITSITLYPSSGNWNAGSTFTLYGFASTANGVKATGGAVYSDADYLYHVFGQSGTFTPTQSLTADILVVGGGGQGGGGNGGGGGAGGLRAFAAQALTATTYNVTVGAGGSGGGTNAAGGNGVASQFGALTAATGGGGGGGYSAGAAGSGGSGGGGGTAGNTTGGAASPSGQGNAGGNGHVTDNLAGGGGGAGVAGGAGTTTTSGYGGNGSSAYSAWGIATGTGQGVDGVYYYAGGASGGGDAASGNAIIGAAGYGGGGLGGSEASGNNATQGVVNTGGGGGGEGGGGAGANGGSGIVIVRYTKA